MDSFFIRKNGKKKKKWWYGEETARQFPLWLREARVGPAIPVEASGLKQEITQRSKWK